MEKPYSWFMRFYGLEDSQIRTVILEIRKRTAHKFSYRLSASGVSMNVFIPAKLKPVREATLFFDTEAEMLSFSNDKLTKKIYHQHSVPSKYRGDIKDVTVRHPDEVAFKVT